MSKTVFKVRLKQNKYRIEDKHPHYAGTFTPEDLIYLKPNTQYGFLGYLEGDDIRIVIQEKERKNE